MALTLAQKIIARAAKARDVRPGSIVTCEVDLAMFHDSSGPRRLQPMLDRLGARIRDPSRVVVVVDHYVPERDEAAKHIVAFTRDWAAKNGVRALHDSEGICHAILPRRGHLKPGLFAVGGDSHSCTGGAFGAYMLGVGATDMLAVLVTGEIWVRVPETIRIDFDGTLPEALLAKDLMLLLLDRFGMNGMGYAAIEYGGAATASMTMQDRMTLCNLAAELGAQTALIAPDHTTIAWLRERGVDVESSDDLQADVGASYQREYRVDVQTLEPRIALPHSPSNGASVRTAAGEPIDLAYIGACTGAKSEDMRAAARLLGGRRISRRVQMLVAPATLDDQRECEADGSMAALRSAGATLLPLGCGACAGYSNVIPEGARVISSTARNFRGRMGSATARVYLASPYTVAASALRGSITDPRDVWQ